MTKFDLKQELDDLPCPDMFKDGLMHYISSRNLEIKSKKELEKIVKEFGNMKIGG